MVNISGSVGTTILEKNNKIYIIFYDIHNNNNYCKNNILYISDFFKQLNKYNISYFIEDYKENFSQYYIWHNDEGTHLNKFNKYISQYKYCKNWNFTDIRLYIGDKNDDIINSLNYIFNLDYCNSNKDLKKLKSFFTSSTDEFAKYYFNVLKSKYINIINNKNNNNKNLFKYFYKGYIINNNKFNNYEYEINLLLDSLMELYTLILLNKNSSKINILYYILLHSINFVYYLKLSGCKVIYDNYTENKISDIYNLDNMSNLQSCTNINMSILSKYLNLD